MAQQAGPPIYFQQLLRNRLDMRQGRANVDDQRFDGLHFAVQRRQVKRCLPVMGSSLPVACSCAVDLHKKSVSNGFALSGRLGTRIP